ncbi:MAG: DUF4340 domain-containing protein [Brevinema sp.]
MKYKNIIVPVTLIILGMGIFAYKKNTQVILKKNILTMPWHSIRKDKLIEIETILYKDTNTFRYKLQKKQGTWYLECPIQIMARQDKSAVLVNDFLNLKPSSILSNISKEEFTTFGLATPSLKVSGIFKDNKTNFFIVGNKTSVGEQYYIANQELSDVVYLIHSSNLNDFISGVSRLIDTYFISKAIDQAQNISLKTFNGEIFIFSNNNQLWKQISPPVNEERDWGIRRFLLQTKELTFNPNTITFNTNIENLEKLKINTNTSPFLEIIYNDGSEALFYIGTEMKNNSYPVYSVSQQLISFSDAKTIDEIFDIENNDFEIKK